MTNEPGVTLTCTNEGCGCRLRIEEPCPHGDTYTCACGHPLRDSGEDRADPPEPSEPG